MNNRLKTILFPVILALAIVLGMFINSVMNRQRMPLPQCHADAGQQTGFDIEHD